LSQRIREGTCFLTFAYDVASQLDLARCGHLLTGTEPARLKQAHRAPTYFQFSPAPLRLHRPIELSAKVDGISACSASGGKASLRTADFTLYDFGAISITYGFPLGGSLEDLVELSALLIGSAELRADSARQVAAVRDSIAEAVKEPGPIELAEDYLMFQIAALEEPCSLDDLLRAEAPLLARILRSERGPLHAQEVGEATGSRISYSPDDACLVDWNAAILFDREADDVRAVLEFANVQLLQMRFLDQRLDLALDRAYDALARRPAIPPGGGTALRTIGELQVDGAVLFERVSNAVKLVGDQYLARVYRLASQRFRLAEWNTSILRKLETIESIYEKLSDRDSHRRTEILEWIVIILIAVEIVMGLLHS
jgi:hypothetical protein